MMEALRLGSNDASIQYMMTFLSDNEILMSLPDGDRSYVSLYRSARALADGEVLAYVPMLNGVGIGLFWGKFLNDKCINANWGILKKYRERDTAKLASDAVLAKVKDDYPALTSIFGTVSKSNLRSYAGALACGFKAQGTIPKSHIHNGKLYDSWILVKEI